MGKIYRFLATVSEARMVTDWFHALPDSPVAGDRDHGVLFFFRNFGRLTPQAGNSPLVNVFLPVRTRGVLTTIGEVHFLATPLAKFPGLNKINKGFHNWLTQHPCVFSHRPDFLHEWEYFLEGSARNWDPDIFALPEGMAALRRGEYFIAHDDLKRDLKSVCRKLELRGVAGIEPA